MTIRPLTRLPSALAATIRATGLIRHAALIAVCRTKPRPVEAAVIRRRVRPRTHACRRRVWAVALAAQVEAWAQQPRLAADTAMYVHREETLSVSSFVRLSDDADVMAALPFVVLLGYLP